MPAITSLESTAHPAAIAPTSTRITRNLILSAVAFACTLALTHLPHALDFPLTQAINSYANHSRFIDWLFYTVDNYYTFSGILLMSLVCGCWFDPAKRAVRSGILTGTSFAGLSAALSRVLQHTLRTHPRPMYDPAIAFHQPLIFAARKANFWNSFPSDHGTVFFGLVAVLFVARSRYRWPALLWLAAVETARNYAGAHYPSDLLGGAALGSLLVWSAQRPWATALGRRIANLAETHPGPFYACIFFAAFQIATLTQDLRSAADAFHLVR